MSEKAKTTISIKKPVYIGARQLAKSEDRDFSFIVERGLISELKSAGIVINDAEDHRSELIAAAQEIGVESAIVVLKHEARKRRRKAA